VPKLVLLSKSAQLVSLSAALYSEKSIELEKSRITEN